MENTALADVDARPARRAYEKVPRKYPRSVAPIHNVSGRTVTDRAVLWLLPWKITGYPGIAKGIRELTGIAWSTLKGYRTGRRPIPGRVARIFSDIIRSRCEAGLAICAELDAIEANYVSGRAKPQGWQIVRDRDGVVRDGRGSFKRKE